MEPIRVIREGELVELGVTEAKMARLHELIARLAWGQTLTHEEIVTMFEIEKDTRELIQTMRGWLSEHGVDVDTIVVP